MNPLYLVDASIYIFRSYFSIPSSFLARDGELVNAVYGYTQFLLDLIELKPVLISVAFDESLVSCYRNQLYPAYKANRDLPDANLEFQLDRCKEITRLLGFHHLSLYDYEADDIIGTLQKKFAMPVTIVTRDKDLGQLLGDDDLLWDFAANEFSGPAEVEQKFGVKPSQIADYLALAGDTVDNIPGAPGIGAKTAAALLQKFGSIDAIYESLDEVPNMELRGAKKVHRVLVDHVDDIKLFQSITRIACDIPIDVTQAQLKVESHSLSELLDFCDEMAFGDRIRDRIRATF
jgi:DNA polymerase I